MNIYRLNKTSYAVYGGQSVTGATLLALQEVCKTQADPTETRLLFKSGINEIKKGDVIVYEDPRREEKTRIQFLSWLPTTASQSRVGLLRILELDEERIKESSTLLKRSIERTTQLPLDSEKEIQKAVKVVGRYNLGEWKMPMGKGRGGELKPVRLGNH